MEKYHTEYRINKKDAERFRTCDKERSMERLLRLQALRPGAYTMQNRSVPPDRYSCKLIDGSGKPLWSCRM